MRVYKDISTFDKKGCVAALGIFDGVHLGHKYLLQYLKDIAKEKHQESLIITFWPHPRLVLQESNENSIKLLNSIDEKINLIEKLGIDNFLIIPFTESLSNNNAYDFMKDYLSSKANISHLIIGKNQTFGHDRITDFSTLKSYSEKHNFNVSTADIKTIDNNRISSTIIRQFIKNGLVDKANELLGYNYFINGTIIHGDQIGRKIDFPTANIRVNHPFKLIPQQGVYAVIAKTNSKAYKGMMNIGTRPTVTESSEIVIEVNLFDFEGEIYDQNIRIEVIKQTRKEKQFSNLEELKEQLHNDKFTISNILKTNIL